MSLLGFACVFSFPDDDGIPVNRLVDTGPVVIIITKLITEVLPLEIAVWSLHYGSWSPTGHKNDYRTCTLAGFGWQSGIFFTPVVTDIPRNL